MTVEIPWNAWFEDGEMALSFPDPWRVDVLRMTAPPAPPATVAERIATPLDSEPLRTLARGKRLVGIAVDDIARPTPVHEFLPQVVDELLAAGVPEDGIQCSWRPARTVRRCSATWSARSRAARRGLKIVYHNPYDNLADLAYQQRRADRDQPQLSGLRPAHQHRRHHPARLRRLRGGYKTVTVGLSGIRALYETHIKRIAEFDAGVARIDGNRFRSTCRRSARRSASTSRSTW